MGLRELKLVHGLVKLELSSDFDHNSTSVWV